MATRTILLVDDEPRVLDFVRIILERAGFHVLSAVGPIEATEIERNFGGKIDVLMTDVVMPGTSGRDLAVQFTGKRPEMRVILMSGYADAHMLRLEPGWDFIRKPFMPSDVRSLLKQLLTATSSQSETVNHLKAGT